MAEAKELEGCNAGTACGKDTLEVMPMVMNQTI